MDYPTRKMQVNGIEMNVLLAGPENGPPVLLVHGFPDDHTIWRHQIPALVAAGYRVIAPDTRGCGESEMPAGPPADVSAYRMENLVADLAALLDALGLDQVRLVAHDWGAFQGWHFAIAHPRRVKQYIALSVGHPSSYNRGGLAQKLKAYYVRVVQIPGMERLTMAANFALFKLMAHYPPAFAHIEASYSRPGRLMAGFSYYRANKEMLLKIDYPPVQMPVVGIWSEGDHFLAEGQMIRSERWCPAGFQYERVDGASHWLQLDAPDQINRLLLKHLKAPATTKRAPGTRRAARTAAPAATRARAGMNSVKSAGKPAAKPGTQRKR